jgi:pimeloyl-ACP methyl ester carboxylesterase
MNVKKLFLGAALLAMFSVSGAFGQSSPLSVVGQWNETFGGLWTLYQEQSGNITGNLTTVGAYQNLDISCSVPVWPVTGAVLSSTQFVVTATNPAGGGNCVAWIQEYVTLASPNTGSAIIYTPASEPNPLGGSSWFLYSGRIIPVDPVVAQLVGTNGVTQNLSAIATATSGSLCPIGTCPLVTGAVADGVTQVVIVVLATLPGDPVQITLTNENGEQDTTGNGGLFALGSQITGNGASTLTVPAQGGAGTPLAVVIWRAPLNYNRGSQYPSDVTTVQRNLTLKVQLPGADGALLNLSQTLWAVRPPVVLIHGLWSSGQGTFGGFYPANPQNFSLWAEMNPIPLDYSAPVTVTASTPSYSWPFLSLPAQITQAALGFSYNAPNLLLQLQAAIANYGIFYNVAAVQADVVAHSMGGDITRVMPNATTATGQSLFATQSNYGLGPIHKLITIGTPHQGSPLAVDLLPGSSGDPNSCVRDILAKKQNVSFQTVTLATGAPANGAVGDLAAAPNNLPSSEPFPMAYLAGTTNAANLQNIDSIGSNSWELRAICYYAAAAIGASSPLAYDITPSLWNGVFGFAFNDGVVPLSSQLNGTGSLVSASGNMSANTFQGVIHSPGFEDLDFSPPTETSPQSGIPDAVINLLNEASNGPDFTQPF